MPVKEESYYHQGPPCMLSGWYHCCLLGATVSGSGHTTAEAHRARGSDRLWACHDLRPPLPPCFSVSVSPPRSRWQGAGWRHPLPRPRPRPRHRAAPMRASPSRPPPWRSPARSSSAPCAAPSSHTWSRPTPPPRLLCSEHASPRPVSARAPFLLGSFLALPRRGVCTHAQPAMRVRYLLLKCPFNSSPRARCREAGEVEEAGDGSAREPSEAGALRG